MGKRLNYNFVKKYIENEGYKLISTKYENIHKKIEIECEKSPLNQIKDHYKNRGKKGVKSGKISRCLIVFFRVFGEMAKKSHLSRDDDVYIDGIRLLSHT